MNKVFLLSSILAVLPLLGCQEALPPLPACRTLLTDADGTAAGCLIRVDDDVLMIRHRLSGRLDIPGGGRKTGESLPCTAHRETFEETGLNINVTGRIGRTQNGMVIYACHASRDAAIPADELDPPGWSQAEVSRIERVNLFTLGHDALRFQDDLIPLRDAFTQARHVPQTKARVGNSSTP